MIHTSGRKCPPCTKSLKLDPAVSVPQAAKVLNYAKWHKTANSMFVVFVATFLMTRLVYFPFWWEWHRCVLLHFLISLSGILIMKDNYSFLSWQGDSLHMGVSAGRLPSLLRLLLLQRDAGCPAGASRLLGFSHFTNVLQVAVQQGTCLSCEHIWRWAAALINTVFVFF